VKDGRADLRARRDGVRLGFGSKLSPVVRGVTDHPEQGDSAGVALVNTSGVTSAARIPDTDASFADVFGNDSQHVNPAGIASEE
jgi:hypothetical protein